MATELDGVDLGFRPETYFWPMGLETHLLSRIKGAERQAAVQALIDSGRLEDIPDLLAKSALSDGERMAIGRINPALMGGEYLPNLKPKEVMVARITLASVTQDVTCVYARRTKHRILYRVVDEYQGDTLSDRRTRSSMKPLTLGQLEAFFMGAWSLFDVLEMNFADDRCDLDEMQRFVSFDSQFYPQFGQLLRQRIEALAAEHAVVDDPDEDSLTEGGQG